jgi:hypothetical protein
MNKQLSTEIAFKHLDKIANTDVGTEREDEVLTGFLKSLRLRKPSKMTEQDANKLLSNLAEDNCSKEFVESLVYWLLRQGISPVAKETILKSDLDGDGVPLWQELIDGTDPFVNDRNLPQKQSYLNMELTGVREMEI